MKKIILSVLFLAAVLAMPNRSYALVDGEFYGGYSFKGELTEEPALSYLMGDDIKGWNYGFRAHLNKSFLFLFRTGIGGFVEFKPQSYDSVNNESVDVKKRTMGIDGYIKLDLPLIPLKPYLRGGLAVYDKSTFEVNGVETESKDYFKSRYYGLGVAFTVLPLPLVDVQIFGEYLNHYSKYSDGDNGDLELKSHSINFGASVSL